MNYVLAIIVKMSLGFIAALVCLALQVCGQDCNGNMVQALQQCAGSIRAGESFSMQQEKCAPNGCNYDCPSTNRLDSLDGQFQDLSGMVQNILTMQGTLQKGVANNTGAIAAAIVAGDNGIQNLLIAQGNLQQMVANNTAEISLIREHIEHPCGSAGWTRIAYLDMRDPSQNCPSELQPYESDGNRACGRFATNGGSCDAIFFPPNGTVYKEVCGRVYGYQKGSTQAIQAQGLGLESHYVDGVSLTYGSDPRNHLWTFMASFKETGRGAWECPCQINTNFGNVASFIGDNYFCESGESFGNPENNVFYFTDPLWDGEQCYNRETPCCQVADLPWFTRTLDEDTTDDIELRVCGNEGTNNEDSPVLLYEIYIK